MNDESLAVLFGLLAVLVLIIILFTIKSGSGSRIMCPCGYDVSTCGCGPYCPNCSCYYNRAYMTAARGTSAKRRKSIAQMRRAQRRGAKREGFDPEGLKPSEMNHARDEKHKGKTHVGSHHIDIESQFSEMYGSMMYADHNVTADVMDQYGSTETMRGAPFRDAHRSRPTRGYGWRRWTQARQAPQVNPYVTLADSWDTDMLYDHSRAAGPKFLKPYDPTPDDDAEHGYRRGDVWKNTNNDKLFVLTDHSTGFAKWVDVPQLSSMSDRVNRPVMRGVQSKKPRGGSRTYLKSAVNVAKEPLSDVVSRQKKTNYLVPSN